MSGLIARILLRLLSGYMISRGLPYDVTDVLSDPAIVDGVDLAIGALVLVVSEGWLVIERKFGTIRASVRALFKRLGLVS